MTELKGIKITSDGTVLGTRVFDADGKDVTRSLYIRSIKWTHRAGGIPVAELSCLLSELEVFPVDATIDERWIPRPEDEVNVSSHGNEYEEYDSLKNPHFVQLKK